MVLVFNFVVRTDVSILRHYILPLLLFTKLGDDHRTASGSLPTFRDRRVTRLLFANANMKLRLSTLSRFYPRRQ